MIDQKVLKQIYINCLKDPNGPKVFIDLKSIKDRFLEIKDMAPANLDFIFPVKSFPHSTFLHAIAPIISGFEFSNQNEFNLIKEVLSPDTTNLASNFFNHESERSFLKGNFCYDIGYLDQIDDLAPDSAISLRLKPPLELYQGEKTRFGLNAEEIQSLASQDKLCKRVISLHFHLGFERTTLQDIKSTIEMCLSYREKYFSNLTSINIGGGITTLSKQDLVDLFAYISNIDLKFVMEAGRYFTENACYGVGQILSLRERPHGIDILTDLSRECHLKWAWPKSFNILNTKPNQQKTKSSKTIQIFGNTAFEGDTLLSATPERELSFSKGDHIVVDNVSGYSIAWNHSFNGVPAAKIIFL
tara:strand:- start:7897 stop:8970 length:1074 start_codon:yes stop_codon:yes gene_type:complete